MKFQVRVYREEERLYEVEAEDARAAVMAATALGVRPLELEDVLPGKFISCFTQAQLWDGVEDCASQEEKRNLSCREAANRAADNPCSCSSHAAALAEAYEACALIAESHKDDPDADDEGTAVEDAALRIAKHIRTRIPQKEDS
jgi:hypothetical protein